MTFLRLVGQHFKNWAAEYTLLPLTILSVIGAAYFVYFLTGRTPKESGSWLVDYSARCIVIALAITFTSAARQALGIWMRKEEQFAHPVLAIVQSLTSLILITIFIYTLSH